MSGYTALVPKEPHEHGHGEPQGHYHADGTFHLSSDHEDPDLYEVGAECHEHEDGEDSDCPKPMSKKALKKLRCGCHVEDGEGSHVAHSLKPLDADSEEGYAPL